MRGCATAGEGGLVAAADSEDMDDIGALKILEQYDWRGLKGHLATGSGNLRRRFRQQIYVAERGYLMDKVSRNVLGEFPECLVVQPRFLLISIYQRSLIRWLSPNISAIPLRG